MAERDNERDDFGRVFDFGDSGCRNKQQYVRPNLGYQVEGSCRRGINFKTNSQPAKEVLDGLMPALRSCLFSVPRFGQG